MQTYGVALFYSTREAMKAEEIHASCGFSLKYPLKEEEALMSLLTAAEIASEGFYHAAQEGLKTNYILVQKG